MEDHLSDLTPPPRKPRRQTSLKFYIRRQLACIIDIRSLELTIRDLDSPSAGRKIKSAFKRPRDNLGRLIKRGDLQAVIRIDIRGSLIFGRCIGKINSLHILRSIKDLHLVQRNILRKD